jgi:anti-sigma-K factor RskA
MSVRSHEDYQENIGAFVLGALPELEAELMEKHLAGCESCRAEVDELSPVTAAMRRSVPQVEPPPSLKASLMRTVNEEAALRAGPLKAPREKRRWTWFEGWSPRLAAGIAVAVLALAVGIGVATDPFGGGGPSSTTITAQIDRKLMPTGTAVLQVSGRDGELKLRNAPAPPAGHVYQLWFQHGKTIERGGTFRPQADGSYRADLSVSDTDAVMVTVERAGGAPAPTGPPVMQFRV